METHTVLLFLGVDLLLICTPGPDWLYVIARSLAQGPRAGLVAVTGVCTGYAIHTLLAAAGFATALAAIPAALPVLRYAGAAYLVVLAVRMLTARRRTGPVVPPATPNSAVLRQSILTALLNPKGLLLYLSLMPQFVSSNGPVPVAIQVAALGLLHIAGCALVYGAVGIATGHARRAITTTPKATRRMTTISATLLMLVAALTVSTT